MKKYDERKKRSNFVAVKMISYAETEQVRYIRLGATAPTNLKMTQIDISDDERHLEVTWDAAEDATSYILTLVNGDGSKNIVETVTGTSYTLKGVQMKERWEATLIAQNNDGKALPVEASAKIGGKIPAFLSEYATPEELIANGDDDEASAWLWFQTNYPKGEYVYFGTINRLSTSLLRGVGNAFGCGAGGFNPDVWKMGVCLNTGSFSKDFSSHPIYAGIETEKLNDNCFKAIAMKGAGWTEDHNCLFFDIPAKLTGLDVSRSPRPFRSGRKRGRR